MSKRRRKFEIHSYEDCKDGFMIFWGEYEHGKIGARVQISDIIDNHPGETGYNPDMDCDRAHPYHIPAPHLWDNGTDGGHPIAMAQVVWDSLSKVWIDEEGNFINKHLRALHEHGYHVGYVEGNIAITRLYDIGQTDPDAFGDLPRLLYIRNHANHIEVVFEIEE